MTFSTFWRAIFLLDEDFAVDLRAGDLRAVDACLAPVLFVARLTALRAVALLGDFFAVVFREEVPGLLAVVFGEGVLRVAMAFSDRK